MTAPYGKDRYEKALGLYRDGMTVEQIATEIGCSVPAARMCLDRAKGFRDARTQRKYGCSYDVYKSIGSAISIKFCHHRKRAMRRGVGFELTLPEWWKIWSDSGHWDQMGNHHGEYVMCRNRDTGPYAVGNVFIELSTENVLMGYRWRAETRKPELHTEAI